jgi:hypothetical protein
MSGSSGDWLTQIGWLLLLACSFFGLGVLTTVLVVLRSLGDPGFWKLVRTVNWLLHPWAGRPDEE